MSKRRAVTSSSGVYAFFSAQEDASCLEEDRTRNIQQGTDAVE
jgi:hypothetical protein